MVRIALIAEKPSLAIEAVKSLLRVHPDLDPDFFVRVFTHSVRDLDWKFDIALDDAGGAGFRYPRGLKWHDFPAIRTPAYKPIDLAMSGTGNRMSSKKGVGATRDADGTWHPDSRRIENLPDDYDARHHFRDADIVYGAMDPSSSAVHAFERAVEVMFPDGPGGRDIRYPWFTNFTRRSFDEDIRGARPWTEVRAEHLGHSLVKRHFTFNYAFNAHAILGRALAEASLETDAGLKDPSPVVASRNCLQLLFWFRSIEGSRSEGLTIEAMSRWKGTGRYDRRLARDIFGSAASRWNIVLHLRDAGLLAKVPREGKPDALAISDFGRAYLDRLHPDCEDPDQGFRLEEWRRLPTAEAFPKVERYIRTFFGKQKRFGAKVLRR